MCQIGNKPEKERVCWLDRMYVGILLYRGILKLENYKQYGHSYYVLMNNH